MSESRPNNSRTFITLSGEASRVSARLSGWTLERSVMDGALNRLGRQGKERHETLFEPHVSFDCDRFWGRAAVDYRRKRGGRRGEGHVAALGLPPLHLQPPIMQDSDIAG